MFLPLSKDNISQVVTDVACLLVVCATILLLLFTFPVPKASIMLPRSRCLLVSGGGFRQENCSRGWSVEGMELYFFMKVVLMEVGSREQF